MLGAHGYMIFLIAHNIAVYLQCAVGHTGCHAIVSPGCQRSGRDIKGPEVRKNIVSNQGRPLLAVSVREMLFQWFCDIRQSVQGRLPVAVVMAQADLLVSQYTKSMLAAGRVPRAPKITRGWVWSWRKAYGVSFRKPNRRFKLTRKALLVRLKIFWLNNIRVRHFARLTLKVDVGRHVDNCDQKGWYMNHAGAREKGTLSLAGCDVVPLKENHAATRTRLSLMTWTSNSVAMIENKLPLELCFKSDSGERLVDELRLPSGKFSVRFSESGSYREQHVFLFLQMHLPEVPDARNPVQ